MSDQDEQDRQPVRTDAEALRAIRRIFGPPGTGKTTELARRVRDTVAREGGGGIRIASFSRTAAAEIGSRQEVRTALPQGAVGTMHHHAYAAIGNPPLALDSDHIKGWNEQVGQTWRVTAAGKGGGRSFESRDRAGAAGAGSDTGDSLLEQMDLLRACQTPTALWPQPLKGFARRWTDWKREAGVVDFADMIIQAYRQARDGQAMPGEPNRIIVDEAQDMTPIEVSLALEWGRHLDPDAGGTLVFALDDDQAIMEWRGGDPRRILGLDLVEQQSHVLSQSYRVPPAVHAAAEQWIRRCATRFPKEYLPRGATENDASDMHSRGWAQRAPYTLQSPDLLDAIEADLEDPDLSDEPAAAVMVIASCGYMLDPMIKGLKARGIPFHNPYRTSDGQWNPLGTPGRGTSTAQRIYRYAVVQGAHVGERARRWTGEDLRLWMEMINVREAQLAHRVRSHLLPALPDGEVPDELLLGLFRDSDEGDEALSRATRGDLDWLASVITDERRARTAAFPLQVARTRGATSLATAPRVVVGTIHSTKGAQASRVYLAPDLSAAGRRQWQSGADGRDQLVRLFYVGLTRAYHGVTVLAPNDDAAVPPTSLLPADLEVQA